MDPAERLTCEELLELPYFQDEGGVGWGRESERPTRRREKGARRRVPGVNKVHASVHLNTSSHLVSIARVASINNGLSASKTVKGIRNQQLGPNDPLEL